jgi:hypothetical protein
VQSNTIKYNSSATHTFSVFVEIVQKVVIILCLSLRTLWIMFIGVHYIERCPYTFVHPLTYVEGVKILGTLFNVLHSSTTHYNLNNKQSIIITFLTMSTKTENVYVAELLYLIALDDTGLTNECVTVKHAGSVHNMC